MRSYARDIQEDRQTGHVINKDDVNFRKNRRKRKMKTGNEVKQGEEIVDHPGHYNHGKYECIDVIDDLNLNFNLGSVLKYLWRAGFKDDEMTELEKARWYLDREIQTRRNRMNGRRN